MPLNRQKVDLEVFLLSVELRECVCNSSGSAFAPLSDHRAQDEHLERDD